MKTYLSLGYDTEKPYGPFAETPEGRNFRKKHLEFISNLITTLNKEGVPRTFFILGNHLKNHLTDFSSNILRNIYDKNNPLNDLQQHSYSHGIFRTIKKNEDRKIMSVEDFIKDLEQANSIMKEILDVNPIGLRTPLGYHKDLSDLPEFVAGLESLGIKYVSSDLRSEENIYAQLNELRQPHSYKNINHPKVIEIPSHGWQDTIFTGKKAEKYIGRTNPFTIDEIVKEYMDLFELSEEFEKSPLFICLCLHPQAIMEYDPNLEITKRIIDSARNKNIEIISYTEVYNQIL